MKILTALAVGLTFLPLRANARGAALLVDDETGTALPKNWRGLPECPAAISPKASSPLIAADDAKLCQVRGKGIWDDVAYPVLDLKTGKAKMKFVEVARGSLNNTLEDASPEAAKGWKEFVSDKGTFKAFPDETRSAVLDLFDKNKVEVPGGEDGKPKMQDVGKCGDENGANAKNVNMGSAMASACYNGEGDKKTYTVPGSVDCKTGAISWTKDADRSRSMTAINTFRIDAAYCSSAKFAPENNRADAIETGKVGKEKGDRSKAMKFAQKALNVFLGSERKDAFADNPNIKDTVPLVNGPTKLVEDGKRGENTRRAILMFQATNQLPQTGVLDEGTMKSLNEQYQKQAPIPARYSKFHQVVPPPPIPAPVALSGGL